MPMIFKIVRYLLLLLFWLISGGQIGSVSPIPFTRKLKIFIYFHLSIFVLSLLIFVM
uniref:Uncharacterized protein n=1 Tax=Rhizophora mucronata TaxID=61149 RepID=A0A2P2IWN3_RHIMU